MDNYTAGEFYEHAPTAALFVASSSMGLVSYAEHNSAAISRYPSFNCVSWSPETIALMSWKAAIAYLT